MRKKSAKTHIKEVGEERYWRAYDRAMFVAKQVSKLTGLNKIREAIAHEAALQATGFEARPFSLAKKGCGEPTIEMQKICDGVFPEALAAAQDAVGGRQ